MMRKKIINNFVFREKKYTFFLIFSIILNAILVAFTTFFYGECINRLSIPNDIYNIFLIFSLYAIFQIIILVFNTLNSLLVNFISKKIMIRLRMDLYERLLSEVKLYNLYENNIDTYSSCFINDIKQIDNQYIYQCISMLNFSMRILFLCILIALYNWIVFALTVLVLSLVFIISYCISKKISFYSNEKMKANQSYLSYYSDVINGFDEYVYSNKRGLLYTSLERININLEKKDLVLKKKIVKVSSINTIIKSLGFILIIIASVILSSYNLIKIGALLSTFEIVSILTSDVGSLSNNYQSIIEVTPIIDKYSNLINISNEDKKYKQYNILKHIEFVNFTYRSQSKIICENVNLLFEMGKKYAITGESGSGKTTIISALLGIINNYEGYIMIDGMNLKKVIEDYSLNFNYIDQKQFIFNDTIYNNITLGKKISKEKLEEILEITKVNEIINNLPNGIDNILEYGGTNISGGEKQKIVLARALASECNVYIFDESFSEVDDIFLKNIEEYLLESECTLIYITHKIKNKEMFDRVYYINRSVDDEEYI